MMLGVAYPGLTYPGGVHHFVGSSDTTSPVVTVVSVSKTKISRISPQDFTDVQFSADENFVEYQIRVVPANDSLVTAGTLIESGLMSGNSGTQYTKTITDDELVAASSPDGSKIIKIFVKDAAGNWSS